MAPEVHLHRLGLINYHDAWSWQQQTAAAVRNGAPEALAILQHPPVYTLGRRARPENILLDLETLALRGAEVVETDRGGDVTFHGPGQLVAYPILNLRARNLDAADYVRLLEETMLRTAQRFGIAAERIPGRPGIWTVQHLAHATSSVLARSRSDEATSALRPTPPRPPIGSATSPLTPVLAKLGALGVRVHGGVSTHGLALNVDADLSCFDAILPCGLPGVTVTSLERLLGYSPGLHAVEDALLDAFEHVFESTAIASHSPPARNDPAGFIQQGPTPRHCAGRSGAQSPLSSQGNGIGGEVTPTLATNTPCAPLAGGWGQSPHVKYQAHAR